ncbi:unnamed protein product [Timema podura]|uniref:Importin N-terminal domain-containing protein n=1 Tax=Timema podura TaxID=61482 RepID=A0ABN7NWC1_TIMPD|nr:unnamed protein product [Timema podura]
MLQFPSHTTHRMHPLDVAFFRPLGWYYIQAQEAFLRQNMGKSITQYDVVALLAEAYGRAVTVGTVENAFKAAGIWPLNRHVFRDHDFAPSDVLRQVSNVTDVSTPLLGSFSESLSKVSPVLQAATGFSNQRKQQNTHVITSTPYKENLEKQKSKLNEKLTVKPRRALFASKSSAAVSKNKKKKFMLYSDDSYGDFVASHSSLGGHDFVDTDDFQDFDHNELKEIRLCSSLFKRSVVPNVGYVPGRLGIHKIIGFAPSLLQVVMLTDVDMPVRQAGVIYLKNLVTQHWADKEAEPGQPLPFSVHEQDRAMIRDAIVDAVVHAPDLIKVQLSVCVSNIVKHDFPGRWTQIVDKISIYLQNPDAAGWTGALMCLYQLVKNFE